MATASVSMEDLIGDTSALRCEKGSMQIRGLQVTYWCYSSTDAKVSASLKAPMIALHGGPAFTHNYILPLKLLALQSGHPVIFYDQAGCGESDLAAAASPTKDTPWLLTVEYYVEELLAIVNHLGLTEYYVYGSSWGSMLAQEYAVHIAVNTLPSAGKLLGLVLDGALCDGDLYIASQWRERISTLPLFTQRLLRKLEDKQAYDTPEYKAIETVLTSHFTCRLVPKPDCWFDSIKGQNKEIYTAMQGASEFTFAGVLQGWSITERLNVVKVPTLVVRGEYDTMTEECHQLVVDSISTAHPIVHIPRAGHCKIIDEPQLCCEVIAKFLVSVEVARKL
eukprot:m.263729 g.263729  ORF g.263729 m.263729 type:complete len:336 (-) comp51811_c0_seq1:127-1134(-)